MTALSFDGSEVRTLPYLHATVAEVFEPSIAADLLQELTSTESWQHHRGDFFEQYEVDLLRHGTARAKTILDTAALAAVRAKVAELLMADLDDEVKVIGHRLLPGQGIGLHNDAPHDDAETHRLVVHLGEYESDARGGHLVLFSAEALDAIDRVIRPLHNSGMCFEASSESYHAVSEVKEGIRHSVVFSFWRRRDPLSVEAFEAIGHSGGTLADHLRATHELLIMWGASEAVALAGLMHSGYGTEHFAVEAAVDPGERARVRDRIGDEAERLVWLFSSCRRSSIGDALVGGHLLGHQDDRPLPATRRELEELLLIDLADTVEQLPRTPIDDDELDAEIARFEQFAAFVPPAALEALRGFAAARSK